MHEIKTMGSLFDGSGGFPMVFSMVGVKPIWASEIEPFPILVTRARFPNMKHYGDISKINGTEIEPVDVISGGSPCQDMSVAGKRAGLGGKRSGLFMEQIRIVKEMRDNDEKNGRTGEHIRPRFMLWENVPGAYSSNKGDDFLAVLEEVARVKEPNIIIPRPEGGKWTNDGAISGDGWSVAWRTLDAQYWRVPQRRRRIALVADFAGQRAAEILFKREGLSWHTSQSQSQGEGTSGNIEESTGVPGENDRECIIIDNHPMVMNERQYALTVGENVANTLTSTDYKGTQCVFEPKAMAFEPGAASRMGGYCYEEKCGTLRAQMGDNQACVAHPITMQIRSGCEGGGKGALLQHDKSATLGCNNTQTLFEPKAYGICSQNSNSMLSDNPHSGIYEAKTARTLDANGGNPSCNQGGIAVCIQGSMIGRKDENGPQGDGVNEDVSFTLNTTDRHAVAMSEPISIDRATFNQGENARYGIGIREDGINRTLVSRGPSAVAVDCRNLNETGETYPTLQAKGQGGWSLNYSHAVRTRYIVRRLTPLECSRLQGFPDWWTKDTHITEPTEEDLKFWREVFETHRKIVSGATKPKTDKQIIKWLKDPYNDSAEYKMWGNGIAAPPFLYVAEGIAEVLYEEEENKHENTAE